MAAGRARVGIVLRTKDRPVFLERALLDILSQTFRDWHVVIANDGGDVEEVRSVVEGVGGRLHDRVTVLDVAAPHGRCAAANQGLHLLESPYVVLHDDDDSWDPAFLATTVAWLDDHPDHAGAMVPTEIVYEEEVDGRFRETGRAAFWPGMTAITFVDLLSVNRAVPISFLYRRELHKELGPYDETLETVEDWDFYLRIAARHVIGFVAGRPLAFWSQRPSAVGSSANSMFALSDAHRRDDALVRDRALRAWVAAEGPGLPLVIAGIVNDALLRQEATFRRLLREQEEALHRRSLMGYLGRIRRRVTGGRRPTAAGR